MFSASWATPAVAVDADVGVFSGEGFDFEIDWSAWLTDVSDEARATLGTEARFEIIATAGRGN